VLCALSIRWLSRVLTLGSVLASVCVAGFLLERSGHVAKAWPMIAVGAAGVLAYLEAAIILGAVTLWYNAVLIFATTLAGLIVLEGVFVYATSRLLKTEDVPSRPLHAFPRV